MVNEPKALDLSENTIEFGWSAEQKSSQLVINSPRELTIPLLIGAIFGEPVTGHRTEQDTAAVPVVPCNIQHGLNDRDNFAYANTTPFLSIGRCVTRGPSSEIAFAKAGPAGGRPGSPTPVGASEDGTICVSICAMSLILSGR